MNDLADGWRQAKPERRLVAAGNVRAAMFLGTLHSACCVRFCNVCDDGKCEIGYFWRGVGVVNGGSAGEHWHARELISGLFVAAEEKFCLKNGGEIY